MPTFDVVQVDLTHLPPAAGRRGAPRMYPHDEMQVGESFFVPGHMNATRNKLSGSTCQYMKKYGVVFTILRDDKNEGWHCLRMA